MACLGGCNMTALSYSSRIQLEVAFPFLAPFHGHPSPRTDYPPLTSTAPSPNPQESTSVVVPDPGEGPGSGTL